MTVPENFLFFQPSLKANLVLVPTTRLSEQQGLSPNHTSIRTIGTEIKFALRDGARKIKFLGLDMTPTLYLDAETWSNLDLKLVGARAYAEHPSTRVLCWSWAIGDGPVQLLTSTMYTS